MSGDSGYKVLAIQLAKFLISLNLHFFCDLL